MNCAETSIACVRETEHSNETPSRTSVGTKALTFSPTGNSQNSSPGHQYGSSNRQTKERQFFIADTSNHGSFTQCRGVYAGITKPESLHCLIRSVELTNAPLPWQVALSCFHNSPPPAPTDRKRSTGSHWPFLRGLFRLRKRTRENKRSGGMPVYRKFIGRPVQDCSFHRNITHEGFRRGPTLLQGKSKSFCLARCKEIGRNHIRHSGKEFPGQLDGTRSGSNVQPDRNRRGIGQEYRPLERVPGTNVIRRAQVTSVAQGSMDGDIRSGPAECTKGQKTENDRQNHNPTFILHRDLKRGCKQTGCYFLNFPALKEKEKRKIPGSWRRQRRTPGLRRKISSGNRCSSYRWLVEHRIRRTGPIQIGGLTTRRQVGRNNQKLDGIRSFVGRHPCFIQRIHESPASPCGKRIGHLHIVDGKGILSPIILSIYGCKDGNLNRKRWPVCNGKRPLARSSAGHNKRRIQPDVFPDGNFADFSAKQQQQKRSNQPIEHRYFICSPPLWKTTRKFRRFQRTQDNRKT